jgi:hypothetical protein
MSSTLLIGTNNKFLIASYLNNVTIHQHLEQTLLKLINSNKNLLGQPNLLGALERILNSINIIFRTFVQNFKQLVKLLIHIPAQD